jgi:DNA-binding NtrC family response regulator
VVDFSERYKTTPVQLEEDARNLLVNYPFPGNVRELKNLAEQISVLTTQQLINANGLRKFLPERNASRLPILASTQLQGEFANEREILYKLFFDMKKDVTELKKMFLEILQNPSLAGTAANFTKESLLNDFHTANGNEMLPAIIQQSVNQGSLVQPMNVNNQAVFLNEDDIQQHEEVEESLNIMDKEKELIIKALKKHKGKRKDASADLGISERTLYRKLKEYDIDDL